MEYSVNEIYDFYELYNTSWSGAINTLEIIKEYNLQDQYITWLNNIIEECCNGSINRTELNDFIWFEDMENLDFFKNCYESEEITEKQYNKIKDYYGIESE